MGGAQDDYSGNDPFLILGLKLCIIKTGLRENALGEKYSSHNAAYHKLGCKTIHNSYGEIDCVREGLGRKQQRVTSKPPLLLLFADLHTPVLAYSVHSKDPSVTSH